MNTPPGWYPDPQHHGLQRYWDGQQWTQHSAPAAIAKKSNTGLVLGIIAGVFILIALLFAGCAVIVGSSIEEGTTTQNGLTEEVLKSAITQDQYESIRIGSSKTALIDQLGEPISDMPYDETTGYDCVLYNRKNYELVKGYMFCFDSSDTMQAKEAF